MKIFEVIVAALLSFFVISSASGGGGGSSSGGGTNVCLETGAETVTHSGPAAHPAQNGTFPLRIVLNENTVTIGHCSNDQTATLASDGSFTLTLNRGVWDENLRFCLSRFLRFQFPELSQLLPV